MGLSSKHVISSDGHGWNHQGLLESGNLDQLQKPSSLKRQSSQQQEQQQQQSEPLKCPRCNSTNTKFCYYNNYNKSQPRHFCKACKRHWTLGGTLRNVPAGGGRKNKRLKTTHPTNKTTSKTTTTTTALLNGISSKYNDTTVQPQQPRLGLPLTTLASDHKNFSEAFYQTLGRQPCTSLPENSIIFNAKSLNDGNNGFFLGSTLSLLPNDQDPQFYSHLGIFESNPCSISSNQSPNLYNYYAGKANGNGYEERGMNSLNTSMSSSSMSDQQQPWEIPTSNEAMDFTSNWGWDYLDKFVSVEADLTLPWDDAEIKP